jgi:hypothetical protein
MKYLIAKDRSANYYHNSYYKTALFHQPIDLWLAYVTLINAIVDCISSKAQDSKEKWQWY